MAYELTVQRRMRNGPKGHASYSHMLVQIRVSNSRTGSPRNSMAGCLVRVGPDNDWRPATPIFRAVGAGRNGLKADI